MINKVILSVSIAAALFFVGCSTTNVKQTAKADVTLTNTYFKAVSLNGKKAEVFEKEPFIKFEAKGSVIGNLGCNSFFGSFKKQNKNISFENIGSTKMMCPNIKTEDAFAKVLQNVKTYEIRGESLTFFNEKDEEIATFKAIYF
ncbi:MAG: META domain-containing protein [Arcobacteraceae bacterium]